MSFDTKLAKRRLIERIGKIKADREQQKLFEKEKTHCKHEWKFYKETIKIDWNARAIRSTPRIYSGPPAPYFVVKGCSKCKQKKYVDMRSN